MTTPSTLGRAPGTVAVLVVATGADGGIGRYERLLMSALERGQSSGSLAVRGLARRDHPSYLAVDPSGTSTPAGPRQTQPIRRFVMRFARAVRAQRPDLIIFTHVNLARLAPIAAALRVPYVVVAHGVELWERLPALKRRALLRAAVVVCVSDFTAGKVVDEQGASQSRVAVVPLALEPGWLRAGEAVQAPPHGGSRLLSVSRLDSSARDKRIDAVIRALPQVAAAHGDVRYHVVGEGDDVERLRALAAEVGMSERVTFTGPLPHEALLEEYASADVFVLPSEREGFGLAFLEAMAFAKPVVARAASAAPEVVVDGETGRLVRSDDEVAPAINELLGDRARAARLGSAGRARASSHFAFDRFVERVEGAIGRAVERRS